VRQLVATSPLKKVFSSFFSPSDRLVFSPPTCREGFSPARRLTILPFFSLSPSLRVTFLRRWRVAAPFSSATEEWEDRTLPFPFPLFVGDESYTPRSAATLQSKRVEVHPGGKDRFFFFLSPQEFPLSSFSILPFTSTVRSTSFPPRAIWVS